MTFTELIHEVLHLPRSQQQELWSVLQAALTDEPDPPPLRSLLELEGVGAELWQGRDAQSYVNELRSEWDERP